MEPLLPDRTPPRGGRWRDHRQVMDAIAWKFQNGSQWVHLPAEYGSWKGVFTRLWNCAIDGTWKRVLTAMLAQADADADADGDLDWAVAVDYTSVRVHQNEAGAREKKKGVPAGEPVDHAIGRSRGGLTTKIHLAADSLCRPLCFVLTPGQAGDAPAFDRVMAAVRIPRRVGRPSATELAIRRGWTTAVLSSAAGPPLLAWVAAAPHARRSVAGWC
ncbi:IS5 family transposase [Streptomyces sp. NPDC091215]|uniref:IS5 family transposase n=1 Tax=Streptomyces sp. NPDC091215 TaxID=3155192 RepID=UPI00344AA809